MSSKDGLIIIFVYRQNIYNFPNVLAEGIWCDSLKVRSLREREEADFYEAV